MDKENKNFLKIMLTIVLIFGIIGSLYLVISLVEAGSSNDDLTTCERMCYPNSVDEEVPNKKCVCSPMISDH